MKKKTLPSIERMPGVNFYITISVPYIGIKSGWSIFPDKKHDFYGSHHADDMQTSYTDDLHDELTCQLNSIQLHPSVWIMKFENNRNKRKKKNTTNDSKWTKTKWNSFRNSIVHFYIGHIYPSCTHMCMNQPHRISNAIFAPHSQNELHYHSCVFHDIWLFYIHIVHITTWWEKEKELKKAVATLATTILVLFFIYKTQTQKKNTWNAMWVWYSLPFFLCPSVTFSFGLSLSPVFQLHFNGLFLVNVWRKRSPFWSRYSPIHTYRSVSICVSLAIVFFPLSFLFGFECVCVCVCVSSCGKKPQNNRQTNSIM